MNTEVNTLPDRSKQYALERARKKYVEHVAKRIAYRISDKALQEIAVAQVRIDDAQNELTQTLDRIFGSGQ